MTQYIALLRGINVSGQKSIKMVDLVALCQEIGFEEVSTYIQSGNICFKSANNNIDELETLLHDKISHVYQFDVPVLIITVETLSQVYRQLPFDNIDLSSDGSKVLISFLSNNAKLSRIEQLMSYVKAPERLEVNERVIYLHCPNGYGKSKLSNNFIETKLQVNATTRNLKTVVKLISLSH
ncbi:DUF1697 domain-containing protein [Colwelliaceae bacterium 6441]